MMCLFQSLYGEVNVVPEPSQKSSLKFKEHKDAAPAFKVVLLQNLKMQFVRLETSKEAINLC